MIEGGCFCKKIRYAIDDGAYPCADCHCTLCRRIHAAPYVTWIAVPAHTFRYTRAAPTVLQSSTQGTRYFCSACGSHVACIISEHPETVDVPLGSLDQPERFVPDDDVFADTRLSWLPIFER